MSAAVGSQADLVGRLQSYLPRRWFGDFSSTPIVNGLLNGMGSVLALMYALILYFRAQTRLQTSTDGWIDLWASDFFGNNLPRGFTESDTAYIARIQATFLQRSATRPAMALVLTNLTGRAPTIFEPANPIDTGCFGANQGVNSFFGGARFGSIYAPFSALITVYRPSAWVMVNPGAAFFHEPTWSAFHTPGSHGYFANLDADSVTDAQVYATINAVKPVGSNIGVCIMNQPLGVYGQPVIDGTGNQFILDHSTLS